jgi:hypothetical protein
MSEAKTCDAVEFLDLLLEFFEDGRRWIRGFYRDDHGNRCLVGAIHYLARKHKTSSAAAVSFLQEVLPKGRRHLVFFNDTNTFAEVRAVIVKARTMAAAEAKERVKREAAAEKVKRWLLAEIERERTMRAAAGDERPTYILCPRAPASPERLAA